MKAKICDYRGFEISFDTDKEKFYLFSDSWDAENEKPSFASSKKYIDDFIKENKEFKPFVLVANPKSWKRGTQITVIGIRKDGRFVYEDESGKKFQLSEYNESDWILPNTANDPIIQAITEKEKQISALNKDINVLKDNLLLVTAKDIKKRYIEDAD